MKNTDTFSATSVDQVLKKLTSLDQSASAGNGSIPTKVIKYCARFFAPILSKIFNHCIKQAMVTNDLTHAIISPLFRGKGAWDELYNYRLNLFLTLFIAILFLGFIDYEILIIYLLLFCFVESYIPRAFKQLASPKDFVREVCSRSQNQEDRIQSA